MKKIAKSLSLFPDVDACETIQEIRAIHSVTIYQSRKYDAVMKKWQDLCLGEAMILANINVRGTAGQWRKLSLLCSSNTPAEKIAIAGCVKSAPRSRDFQSYSRRVIREGRQAIAELGLEKVFRAW